MIKLKAAVSKYYLFIPLLLLCGWYAFKAINFPIHDFSNYYFGGKFLSEGTFDSNVYFPYLFNKAIADSGCQGVFASYAPNTPFLAVLFLPFSLFSVGAAKVVFNIISIGLFIYSIYRLFSFYKINPKIALLIPILFLVPIKNNLLFGQLYFLLFFLIAEGWLAYEKQRWKWTGIYWALAILIKIFPLLLVVFLLFKKQWKPLLYMLISGMLLLGISIFFTGINIWKFYIEAVLPKASNGEIASALEPNYQSVFMFLKQLLVIDPTVVPIVFTVVIMLFKIGILVLGYFVSKKMSDAFLGFSYWIVAMILLSPYGSTYFFVLMVFPFLAMIKSKIADIVKVSCCLILMLINNLPLPLFIHYAFPISFLRMYLLLMFFMLFLICLWQKNPWKWIAAFAVIFISLSFLPKRNASLLVSKLPILIYDYKLENNQLTFFYWNEKGENRLNTKFFVQSVEPLDLKGNQAFYNNKQLTFDNGNKLKPLLINHKIVFYLSDYGRGIGFYTLTNINLK